MLQDHGTTKVTKLASPWEAAGHCSYCPSVAISRAAAVVATEVVDASLATDSYLNSNRVAGTEGVVGDCTDRVHSDRVLLRDAAAGDSEPVRYKNRYRGAATSVAADCLNRRNLTWSKM